MQIDEIRAAALTWLCETNANVKCVGVIAFDKQHSKECFVGRMYTALQGIRNHSVVSDNEEAVSDEIWAILFSEHCRGADLLGALQTKVETMIAGLESPMRRAT